MKTKEMMNTLGEKSEKRDVKSGCAGARKKQEAGETPARHGGQALQNGTERGRGERVGGSASQPMVARPVYFVNSIFNDYTIRTVDNAGLFE